MFTIDILKYKNIVILTGAGVSVASGIRPYRGPGGLWEEFDVEQYANQDALKTNPEAVWRLFGALRDQLKTALPNPSHLAIAELEARLQPQQKFTLITQNIDGLHQAGGSLNVIEMHGSIHRSRCSNEECTLQPFADTSSHQNRLAACPICGSPLRPDIVLFGERIPPEAEWLSKRALRDCDLFLAIGTSGIVSPAAEFVRAANYAGAKTYLINLTPMTPPNPYFNQEIIGRAEEILPRIFQFTFTKSHTAT